MLVLLHQGQEFLIQLNFTHTNIMRIYLRIFKKVTVLPDGKNHGLVFILDWSGSMNSVMLDTVKQLYNLIWFCRKISLCIYKLLSKSKY